MKSFLFLLLLVASNTAFAEFNFFGSVRAAKSTVTKDNAFFDSVDNRVSLSNLSTAGFNFHTTLENKYQILSQFILKEGNNIGIDLLQMRYQVSDDFLVRIGKQRLPMHMYSEHIQIQALLPWLKEPREVYSKIPVYSFTGASVEKRMGDYVTFHAYGGDQKDRYYNRDTVYDTSISDLLGARLNIEFKHHYFFVHAFQSNVDLNIETEIPDPTIPTATIKYDPNFVLNSLKGMNTGYRFQNKDLFFLTEYSLIKSADKALKHMDAMYASLGKEHGEKFTSVVTFSTDLTSEAHISPSKTTTYAYNLNYRLDLNNVLKFGVEHINFKERSMASPTLAGTSTSSVFTNVNPGQNFEIYSMMWAFIY